MIDKFRGGGGGDTYLDHVLPNLRPMKISRSSSNLEHFMQNSVFMWVLSMVYIKSCVYIHDPSTR